MEIFISDKRREEHIRRHATRVLICRLLRKERFKMKSGTEETSLLDFLPDHSLRPDIDVEASNAEVASHGEKKKVKTSETN